MVEYTEDYGDGTIGVAKTCGAGHESDFPGG